MGLLLMLFAAAFIFFGARRVFNLWSFLRLMREDEPEATDGSLPVDVWHARNQLADETERGEDA